MPSLVLPDNNNSDTAKIMGIEWLHNHLYVVYSLREVIINSETRNYKFTFSHDCVAKLYFLMTRAGMPAHTQYEGID